MKKEQSIFGGADLADEWETHLCSHSRSSLSSYNHVYALGGFLMCQINTRIVDLVNSHKNPNPLDEK